MVTDAFCLSSIRGFVLWSCVCCTWRSLAKPLVLGNQFQADSGRKCAPRNCYCRERGARQDLDLRGFQEQADRRRIAVLARRLLLQQDSKIRLSGANPLQGFLPAATMLRNLEGLVANEVCFNGKATHVETVHEDYARIRVCSLRVWLRY